MAQPDLNLDSDPSCLRLPHIYRQVLSSERFNAPSQLLQYHLRAGLFFPLCRWFSFSQQEAQAQEPGFTCLLSPSPFPRQARFTMCQRSEHWLCPLETKAETLQVSEGSYPQAVLIILGWDDLQMCSHCVKPPPCAPTSATLSKKDNVRPRERKEQMLLLKNPRIWRSVLAFWGNPESDRCGRLPLRL